MTPQMQSLTDICKGYEANVELIQPYHARVYYSGRPLFDFFPKNQRLMNFEDKKWHTLSGNWKQSIERTLETFLFTESVYVDFKEVNANTKALRVLNGMRKK